jgi:pimeloyl-ACP methyl ester carboxylesterase
VRFFSRGIANPIPEDAIREYIRCYKKPNSITTAANIYRTINLDRERWKKYEGQRINIPTQIIHGILDPVIIKEYIIGVEDCFDQVQVAQLKAGHFIVDELPEEVGKTIHDFLNSNRTN